MCVWYDISRSSSIEKHSVRVRKECFYYYFEQRQHRKSQSKDQYPTIIVPKCLVDQSLLAVPSSKSVCERVNCQ